MEGGNVRGERDGRGECEGGGGRVCVWVEGDGGRGEGGRSGGRDMKGRGEKACLWGRQREIEGKYGGEREGRLF